MRIGLNCLWLFWNFLFCISCNPKKQTYVCFGFIESFNVNERKYKVELLSFYIDDVCFRLITAVDENILFLFDSESRADLCNQIIITFFLWDISWDIPHENMITFFSQFAIKSLFFIFLFLLWVFWFTQTSHMLFTDKI